MEAIQAYYDGNVFVPLVPVNLELNQPALITILDTEKKKAESNRFMECFGALTAESYLEIAEALNDTERVDAAEW